MDTHTRLAAAKQRALEARELAEAAAANYRREVRSAVAEWKTAGLSVRKCAERLGITEGALRDLLRPDGVSRRAPRARTTPQP
jgi:hypothetical protein